MNLIAIFPKPNSMTFFEAVKWYVAMVQLIPKIKGDEYSSENEVEKIVDDFKNHWVMKSRLRLATAMAMYDPTLYSEFFNKFPLPSASEYLGDAFSVVKDRKKAVALALFHLLNITESERAAFPGVIGEMECDTDEGIHVFTKDGWIKKVV